MEYYGKMNIHALTLLCKELLRRGVVTINHYRDNCDVMQKDTTYKSQDVVTIADSSVQDTILKSFIEVFGDDLFIVAEESDNIDAGIKKMLESQDLKKCKLICVIDPIDGTKSFIKNEPAHFGPMFTIMTKTKEVLFSVVSSAWPFYYFYIRKGSRKGGWYIEDKDAALPESIASHIQMAPEKSIKDNYIHLRNGPGHFANKGFPFNKIKSVFKDYDLGHGGIGLSFARLWRQHVSAFLFKCSYYTPWDMIPPLSITYSLGYKTYVIDKSDGLFHERNIDFSLEEKKFGKPEKFFLLVTNEFTKERINDALLQM